MDKKGLKGIAVTDHNTIEGGKVAQKQADRDHIIIVGSEVKTEIGDIIGLFLTNEIRSRKSMEVLDEIQAQNGISVLAHPFRTPYMFRFRHRRVDSYDPEFMQKVNLIEITNARSKSRENLRARELAERFGKPVSAGSDAHFLPEIGSARLVLKGQKIEMENDIKECLLSGMTETQRGRVFFNNFHWYVMTALTSYWHKVTER